MSLIDDYFLLYHGIEVPSLSASDFESQLSDADFYELSALILTITRHELDAFITLPFFKEITHKFLSYQIHSNEDLYRLQSSLIAQISQNQSSANIHLLDAPLEYLVREKILTEDNHKKICSLFEHKETQEESLPEHKSDGSDFLHNKHALNVAINELRTLFINSSGLDKLTQYLESQKFSIGITGVMNAGKSSMINALMGAEVLGTNVIPETANLSLVKYASKPYAKVIYWNTKQWSRIEESALELHAIKTFVDETKKSFDNDLSSYIQERAREDIIDISALNEYTSAAHKHSNLVKMIELGADLHFLKENIELVDTPGLDDVVIQREEITKEYIAQCDLMIHLMNVSQSATQKDIEFIIDAVRYQNITQILIVITRVDMVSAKDIQEVIAYTKSSIERKLREVNADASLDFILKNIKFIALSSKMAMHHKLGEADVALKAGYTLEKTGLPELESYLHETLYGVHSARSHLILHAAKKRLKKTVDQNIELLKYELSLLSKSEEELKIEIQNVKLSQEREQKQLSALSAEISSFKTLLSKHQESLSYIFKEQSKNLQTVLKQRLLDETTYALEKDKSKPTKTRITTLVENSMRHSLVDILRDYRFGIIKKMSRLKESILNYYPQSESEFLTLDLEKHFSENNTQISIETSLELFDKKIYELCSSTKIKSLDEMLKSVIESEFIYIDNLIIEKTELIYQQMSQEFFTHISEPIARIKIGIEEQNVLLKKYTQVTTSDQSNTQNQALEIHNIIKNIELISSRCSL